jgi:carboxyl-terminal processing protease
MLLVQRGDDEPFNVEVIRDRVEIPILRSEITPDNLLHIMLADFSTRSTDEVKKALEDGIEAGVQGVILDLRSNPGGRLDMSINISSLFIEDGVIVSESGEKDIEHKAKGKDLVPDLPLVVLVDGGSASASEIVAGAIQDQERGTLIGETTFGKGSVQRLFNLSDDSILRVTVAKWYTPSGRLIDGEGLEPDIVIPFEFNPDQPELDPQFDAAVAYLLDLLEAR